MQIDQIGARGELEDQIARRARGAFRCCAQPHPVGIGIIAQIDQIAPRAANQQVGAAAPVQPVVPAPAQQRVGRRVADHRIVSLIARAAQRQPFEHEVFEIVAQHPADPRQHRIAACARLFDHRIAQRVDAVGIVAAQALHRIIAAAAIEHIVAVRAHEPVGQHVAGGIAADGAGEDQRLDIGAQREAFRGIDSIKPGIGIFEHGVSGGDVVGVVTARAVQQVRPASTIDDIGAGIAMQHIGMDRAEQILDGDQRIDSGGPGILRPGQPQLHRDARARAFVGGKVGSLLAVERVVPCLAVEDIVAAAGADRVVARTRAEVIVAVAANQPVVTGRAVDDIDHARQIAG